MKGKKQRNHEAGLPLNSGAGSSADLRYSYGTRIVTSVAKDGMAGAGNV
jgi:hypothetical protein